MLGSGSKIIDALRKSAANIRQGLSSVLMPLHIGNKKSKLLFSEEKVAYEPFPTLDFEVANKAYVDFRTNNPTGDLVLSGNSIKFANGEIIHNETDGFISFVESDLIINCLSSGDAKMAFFAENGNDCQILFYEASSPRWSIANDADDSDKLKIDVTTATVGAATKLSLTTGGNLEVTGNIIAGAGQKVYFDGGGNTYIVEFSADLLQTVVGGDIMTAHKELSNGNEYQMLDCSVGFTQDTTSYDSSAALHNFRNSNKLYYVFGSGDTTDFRLFFPSVSGNFTLIVKQDGTGGREVTNYKAFDYAGIAASGSSTVKWAGGSNPTLTTDANHVDIMSFYWDATNGIAYGTIVSDFQF